MCNIHIVLSSYQKKLHISFIVKELLKMCMGSHTHHWAMWPSCFLLCFCTEELQKRNELIRVLTKRVCVVESREEEVQKELRVSQQHLSELEQKRQYISQKCQDFEVHV